MKQVVHMVYNSKNYIKDQQNWDLMNEKFSFLWLALASY